MTWRSLGKSEKSLSSMGLPILCPPKMPLKRNGDFCDWQTVRGPYSEAHLVRARGLQVQILPLRPVIPTQNRLRGLIWGTKPSPRVSYLDMVGVTGSIPVAPTMNPRGKSIVLD